MPNENVSFPISSSSNDRTLSNLKRIKTLKTKYRNSISKILISLFIKYEYKITKNSIIIIYSILILGKT